MKNRNEKISIVFPVYNEEKNLNPLYEKVRASCVEAGVDYEMIFVDNGSTDSSLSIIKTIHAKDNRARYISLSRNFGHQGAIFAGMSYASGDAVITMDADLQHPSFLIPKMIGQWREGAEVVYTTKEDPNLSYVKLMAVKSFYWLISRVSGLQIDFGQSDFRLLDKKVLRIILDMREYHKFLRGQVKWVGFRQVELPYKVEKRYSGKSKFSYGNLFSFALDGILAFSRYPLHILTLIGLITSISSFIFISFVSVIWVLKLLGIPHSFPFPPGWATLVVSILFLSSMQLIMMGVIGEYIGRVYDQSKGRPVYIVRETSEGGQ